MKIIRFCELQMSYKGSADKDFFHTSPHFFTNAFFGLTNNKMVYKPADVYGSLVFDKKFHKRNTFRHLLFVRGV